MARTRRTQRARRLNAAVPLIALAGYTNAGKSTLLNALTGLDRALVDARPGTTRDTIEVSTAPGGVVITWVDTAGVRADPPAGVDPGQPLIDPVEKQGAARAQAEAEHADVLVWVQDGSQYSPSTPPPVAAGQTLLIVRSKADLPADPRIAAELADALPVSVHAASGVAELRAAVTRAVQSLTRAPQAETVAITRQRHADCLEAAAAALVRAIAVLAADEPLELCADDLRDAAAALAEVTGEVTGDDVLGAIFAQFCIGK
jgi:tRNA modification GTPase